MTESCHPRTHMLSTFSRPSQTVISAATKCSMGSRDEHCSSACAKHTCLQRKNLIYEKTSEAFEIIIAFFSHILYNIKVQIDSRILVPVFCLYKSISGFSEVWYRAWFGTKRPWVQVPQPGPLPLWNHWFQRGFAFSMFSLP